MSEAKTYVFQPESAGSANTMAMLAPLLQSRGIDTGALMSMMNNGGFGGNNFMWVIFLFFLMGNGGYGRNGYNGTEYLSAQMNNNAGRELLQQAIAGNSTAISQLATNLHVDTSQINSALCALQSNVQGVANQVGMTSQQVINAIQSGNCQIANQLAQNASDLKNAITTQGYESRLENMEQTRVLASRIDEQTRMLNEKFCELKEREMQDKIDALANNNAALRNEIVNLNQNAVVAQLVQNATAPIANALAAVKTDVDTIKGALPSTINVPTIIASQYGLFGGGYNSGSLWN